LARGSIIDVCFANLSLYNMHTLPTSLVSERAYYYLDLHSSARPASTVALGAHRLLPDHYMKWQIRMLAVIHEGFPDAY